MLHYQFTATVHGHGSWPEWAAKEHSQAIAARRLAHSLSGKVPTRLDRLPP